MTYEAVLRDSRLKGCIAELEQEKARLLGVIDNHLDHIYELERQLGEKTPDIGFGLDRQEIALRFAVAGFGSALRSSPNGADVVEVITQYVQKDILTAAFVMADAFLAAGREIRELA